MVRALFFRSWSCREDVVLELVDKSAASRTPVDQDAAFGFLPIEALFPRVMAGMARVRLDPRALSRVRGVVAKGFRAPPIRRPFPRGGIAGQIAENAADDVFFCGAGISCCPLPRRSRFVVFSCEGGNIILSAAGSMLVYFYARGPRLNNGKIGVFCTLGQKTSTFLARYSRNVPSDSVFSVRSVQNTPISPKWAVREYISVKSCRKAVLWLRWGTFGEDFAMFPRFAQELLIGASRVWPCRTCFRVPLRGRLLYGTQGLLSHGTQGLLVS